MSQTDRHWHRLGLTTDWLTANTARLNLPSFLLSALSHPKTTHTVPLSPHLWYIRLCRHLCVDLLKSYWSGWWTLALIHFRSFRRHTTLSLWRPTVSHIKMCETTAFVMLGIVRQFVCSEWAWKSFAVLDGGHGNDGRPRRAVRQVDVLDSVLYYQLVPDS